MMESLLPCDPHMKTATIGGSSRQRMTWNRYSPIEFTLHKTVCCMRHCIWPRISLLHRHRSTWKSWTRDGSPD